jgi:hypothetical protein
LNLIQNPRLGSGRKINEVSIIVLKVTIVFHYNMRAVAALRNDARLNCRWVRGVCSGNQVLVNRQRLGIHLGAMRTVYRFKPNQARRLHPAPISTIPWYPTVFGHSHA